MLGSEKPIPLWVPSGQGEPQLGHAWTESDFSSFTKETPFSAMGPIRLIDMIVIPATISVIFLPVL